MSPILQLEDLCVRYSDGIEALRGVSLAIEAGERVALLGPNGAGKTSLLLAVMNAVPWTGRIVVDGIELSRRTAEEVRGRCGVTFQSADDQLFMPTLLDDTAFGPLNQGLPPSEAAAAARSAIGAVGLAGLENRPPHHLSAGQKRAATIATILSMKVQILLLDEPAANLDFRSRSTLIGLLKGRPEAMLVATHDLNLVGQLCPRAVVLNDGLLAAQGPAEELLGDSAKLSSLGIG